MAVLGFKDLSGRADSAWISTAVAEMLTTELGATGGLRTIPGEAVGRMRLELALPEADTLAPDTLARVGRNLGADLVLLGSYLRQRDGQVRLDMRLQDVRTGETTAQLAETGDETGLVRLVTSAGSRLRHALGLPSVPSEEIVMGLKAAQPSNLDAQRLYAAALGRLRLLDARGAAELLEKAIAADPAAPLVHSAQADAWATLGQDARAQAAAKKAFELSAGLPREERLVVEARHREAAREWDKAIGLYGRLHAFSPENLEYGLRLVNAQAVSGRVADALATLAELRKLPADIADDPRLDLAEALAHTSSGAFEKERAAAVRAAVKGLARGASLLTARARMVEVHACIRLGDWKRAQAATEEAQAIYAKTGDDAGLAAALARLGDIRKERGELKSAREPLEKSLEIRRRLGFRRGIAASSESLALVADRQGQLVEARRLHEDARAIAQELGERPLRAIVDDNLAVTLLALGELDAAVRTADEALQLYGEAGDHSTAAAVETTIALAQLVRGDLEKAGRTLARALPVLEASRDPVTISRAHSVLAELQREDGAHVKARASHEKALALRTRLGDAIGIAQSTLALAEVDLDDGRVAEAAQAAQRAADAFLRSGAEDDAALAQALLARVRVAAGRTEDALTFAQQAAARAAKTESPRVRWAVALAEAKVLRARGRGADAQARLAQVETDARRRGFVLVAARARSSATD